MPQPLTASIGWSTKADATRAGKEAAEAAVAQLSSLTPQLALVFGSSWFDQPSLVYGVRSVLGTIPLAGGSTAGEIIPQGPTSHSCVVMLLASDVMSCSVGLGEEVDRVPREAGQQAGYTAAQGFRGSPRAGFLLFGDGLIASYAEVVRGLQEALGTSALIVGGMTGDDLRFLQTYQYANDRAVSHAVVGVLLGGACKIGVGIEHGFAPISKPRQITRASANVLYELDGHPAASVYEEYFGSDLLQRMRKEGLTRQGIAFPLGLQGPSPNQWLLRNVIAFEGDGSLSCNGEVLEGSWLQLMMSSRNLALEAAHRAALQAIRPLNRVACALIFDSALRRTLLGAQQAATEIAQIRKVIGPSTPMAGCYTYGEQAPFGALSVNERSTFQTSSVLVVAIGT